MLTSPAFPAERHPSPETHAASGHTRTRAGDALILPSEHLPSGWLPRVLNARDLTVLCLFSVLLVSNVPLIAGAGGAAYLYWWFGFLTFLIPSALVCAQLYRLFPGEGAVYLWANKAFGSFWDTFIGLFCNWFPGALGLAIEAGAVITYVQALNPTWLSLTWQQGVAEIIVLVLAQALCMLAHRHLQRILNTVFFAYSGCFVLLGLAGLIWTLSGHTPQGDLSARGWHISQGTWPVFATVIVSLLGMAVPLNMGAEVITQRSGKRYVWWGVAITIVGYMIATTAILLVLPPKDLANPAFLTEVFQLAFGSTLGTFLGLVMNLVLIVYFVCATAAFNVMFSRLLVVAGVDRRLPMKVQRLNKKRIPLNATLIQTTLNVVFIVILFFVVPAFAPATQGLSFVVFLVTINGASVVWNIAMIGLFLCGILLCTRYRYYLRGQWVVPPVVLYLAAGLGMGASGIAIFFTFFAGSPVPQVLANGDWDYYVLLVVLGSLALGAAYSFLVPEAEDLVAIANTRKAASPRQPSGSVIEPNGTREDSHVPQHVSLSSIRTARPAGSVPPSGNHDLPGELFSGIPRHSSSYRRGNLPGRMG
ncbi:MAG: APC family permease [Ktedonobacteraceae bacterium]